MILQDGVLEKKKGANWSPVKQLRRVREFASVLSSLLYHIIYVCSEEFSGSLFFQATDFQCKF